MAGDTWHTVPSKRPVVSKKDKNGSSAAPSKTAAGTFFGIFLFFYDFLPCCLVIPTAAPVFHDDTGFAALQVDAEASNSRARSTTPSFAPSLAAAPVAKPAKAPKEAPIPEPLSAVLGRMSLDRLQKADGRDADKDWERLLVLSDVMNRICVSTHVIQPDRDSPAFSYLALLPQQTTKYLRAVAARVPSGDAKLPVSRLVAQIVDSNGTLFVYIYFCLLCCAFPCFAVPLVFSPARSDVPFREPQGLLDRPRHRPPRVP